MSSGYNCSLSGAPCTDPVVTRTGYVFERANLAHWFATQGAICPVTHLPLNPTADVFPAAPVMATSTPTLHGTMPAALGTLPGTLPPGGLGTLPGTLPPGLGTMPAPVPGTVQQQPYYEAAPAPAALPQPQQPQQQPPAMPQPQPQSKLQPLPPQQQEPQQQYYSPAPAPAPMSNPYGYPVAPAGAPTMPPGAPTGLALTSSPEPVPSTLAAPTPASIAASPPSQEPGSIAAAASTAAVYRMPSTSQYSGHPSNAPPGSVYGGGGGDAASARADSIAGLSRAPTNAGSMRIAGSSAAPLDETASRRASQMQEMLTDTELVDSLAGQDYRYAPALAAGADGMTSTERLVAKAQAAKVYRPWFVWIISALQIAGLVVSLVVNKNFYGSLIQTSPQFNYMIGPASETLIRVGARFAPCMRDSTLLSVPSRGNSSIGCTWPAAPLASGGIHQCGFLDLCGQFVSSSTPANQVTANQGFRFILPMFLHAGFVHLLMNLSVQLSLVKSLEMDWGWWRIAPVYILSGIFGFLFGGAFSPEFSPSVGCSGAIFGMVALVLIDHIQTWKLLHRPTAGLMRLLFVIIITFFIGLFPQVDNFSHIGGFLIGLLLGVVVMPNINLSCCSSAGRKAKPTLLPGSAGAGDGSGTNPRSSSGWRLFGFSPLNLAVRAAGLIVAGVLFAVMTSAFYKGDGNSTCSWCKYIDCIPAFGQCSVSGSS
ncbi:hypothetical protein AMAG_11972 [Allomyces macrogynus ATCC 38327]|uniref:Rhomboid-type serine protease n=1 Tax=Allomyces macrogynus (strain ATCC 38327) TaxID=578462 RepID=A0A0L0SYY3_ALLM3|nr:hypothetical protein AMAG_11972 [Allomyces macrogynus ATCC 38327]|eukprot:KNE67514.1 hypothetical protein AMAG_11972 [Allomyces macrogynus ATCC 38327]